MESPARELFAALSGGAPRLWRGVDHGADPEEGSWLVSQR